MADERRPDHLAEQAGQVDEPDRAGAPDDDPHTSREELELDLMGDGSSEEGEVLGDEID